jgi:hypothetical protein
LKITPGVTLKFEHSIGMMIAGEIIAEGDLKGGELAPGVRFIGQNSVPEPTRHDISWVV